MTNKRQDKWLIPFLVTLITHIGLLGLLYFIILHKGEREKPKQEEVVLIDLGNVAEAKGDEEPMGMLAEATEATSEPTSVSTPEPQPNPPAPTKVETKPKPEIAKKPVQEPLPTKPQPIKTQTHEESLKRQKAEQAERERQSKLLAEERARQEAIRIAKAEAAAKAKAEEEARAAAERERKRLAAGNSVANAFGGGRGKNTSHGNGEGSGNQGDTKGSAGGTFNLEGRRITSNGGRLATPKVNTAIEGRIVVNIVVDSSGKVTSATVSPRGTDIANPAIRAESLRAARETTFNAQEGADSQRGTITYIYVVK